MPVRKTQEQALEELRRAFADDRVIDLSDVVYESTKKKVVLHCSGTTSYPHERTTFEALPNNLWAKQKHESCPVCRAKETYKDGRVPTIFRYDFDALRMYVEENIIDIDIHRYVLENITRDTVIEGKCKTCYDPFSKTFKNLVNAGGPYCTGCMKSNSEEKKMDTNQKNRGVNNPMQHPTIAEKMVTSKAVYSKGQPY